MKYTFKNYIVCKIINTDNVSVTEYIEIYKVISTMYNSFIRILKVCTYNMNSGSISFRVSDIDSLENIDYINNSLIFQGDSFEECYEHLNFLKDANKYNI